MVDTMEQTIAAFKMINSKSRPRKGFDPLDETDIKSVGAIPCYEGFKVGADPELFIFRGDEVISAHDLLPGTKLEPHVVDCGAVQVDGTAAEFNIMPATSFEEFDHNFSTVIAQLQAMLPKDCVLRPVSSVVYPKAYFDSLPQSAKELGCSPDFNAWEGSVNSPPDAPGQPTLRTAAGHLHFGWTDDAAGDDLQHIMNCCDLVKQLDWYLGGWSTKLDTDPARRNLYGKSGACRIKPYGVEYRVLSNFWVMDSGLRLAVWNRSMRAIQDMRNNFVPDQQPSHFSDLLRQSIDSTAHNGPLADAVAYPLKRVF